jgi:hypothetical protein
MLTVECRPHQDDKAIYISDVSHMMIAAIKANPPMVASGGTML